MNNHFHHYRRKSKSKIPLLVILALLIGGGVYVYLSDHFERQAPAIAISNKIYWNLKKAIPLSIEDNQGIKSYKVSLIQGEHMIVLDEKQAIQGKIKKISTAVQYPKSVALSPGVKTKIRIEASDVSLWNFFAGNMQTKEVEVIIDQKRPLVNIISKSYALRRGGSALVIFEAKDELLSKLSINSAEGREFEVFPFMKEGFYIALVASDIRDKDFKLFINAEDRAGNLTRAFIPFFYQHRNYRTSKINLTSKFLDGKVEQLFYENNHDGTMDYNTIPKLEKFRYINEDLRKLNYQFIVKRSHPDTSKVVTDFTIDAFAPLINSARVGSFGDHRNYYYQGQKVSESYHMGVDFASVKNDKIKLSNPGEVIFAGYNGIYGNMPVIYHGLGLYSIYGHCSTLNVAEGMQVAKGSVIAETGVSGLALGDHLHFGLLVQGIEVRPEEWMDKNWIKTNITNIIKDAKKIIGEI